MPPPSLQLSRRAPSIDPRIVPDRRRTRRVSVTMPGRFMRANKQEYACKLVDICAGGASLSAPVSVEKDERIVAHFDQFGALEGTVVRATDAGFAMKFSSTLHKREKLVAQLTWLINRHELSGIEARRHERFAAPSKTMTMRLDEAIAIECRVLDFSLSGASIETVARPQIGTEVLLGKLRSRVMRHHDTGLGVQFLDVQNAEALRRTFG